MLTKIIAATVAAAALTTVVAQPADAAHHRHRKSTFSCPERRANPSGDPANIVPPANVGQNIWGTLTPLEIDVRESAMDAMKYVLTTGNVPVRAYNDDRQSTELNVRVPAMAAFTVATGLKTSAYDANFIGVSRGDATDYVTNIVHRLTCQHKAVSATGGWGTGWQTAHWAMLIGSAAWMVWPSLSDNDQENVIAMVKAEANAKAAIAAPYWTKADGTVNTPGDSKAEEDAWNSELLLLANTMAPNAAGSDNWRRAAAQYAVVAYSTHSDNSSSEIVNGVTLSSRLNGYNVFENGSVVNHHIIHPDYANQIQMLWQSADFVGLAGGSVPEAMFHNASLVYSGLSTVNYTPGDPSPAGGTFLAPGGPVYQDGSTPDLYFPQGDDWGEGRRALYVSLDAHADVYRNWVNPTGTDPAQEVAQHEADQQALIDNSGANDGRTYSSDPDVAATQDTYPGREEYAAESMATAWLSYYVKHVGLPSLGHASLALPSKRG